MAAAIIAVASGACQWRPAELGMVASGKEAYNIRGAEMFEMGAPVVAWKWGLADPPMQG